MAKYDDLIKNSVANADTPKTFILSSPSKISKQKHRAFSLPAGKALSCPGATDACNQCYAKKGHHVFKNVRKALAENWVLWKNLQRTQQTNKAVSLLLDSISPKLKIFRIHESGDFSSQWSVNMWAKVVKARPNTKFWAYTRSFHLNFTPLTLLPNFTLWASTDEYNSKEAKKFVRRFRKSGVKHAYGPWRLDEPLPDNSFFCPATNGKIDPYGACEECMLCVVKKRTNKNVVFKKH